MSQIVPDLSRVSNLDTFLGTRMHTGVHYLAAYCDRQLTGGVAEWRVAADCSCVPDSAKSRSAKSRSAKRPGALQRPKLEVRSWDVTSRSDWSLAPRTPIEPPGTGPANGWSRRPPLRPDPTRFAYSSSRDTGAAHRCRSGVPAVVCPQVVASAESADSAVLQVDDRLRPT